MTGCTRGLQTWNLVGSVFDPADASVEQLKLMGGSRIRFDGSPELAD